jgi:uncharacterized protein (TIGR03437 family)
MNTLNRLLVGCLLVSGTAFESFSQVCRLTVHGVNQNRRVIGNVTAECPPSLHSVPFGNWGVTSNFGGKLNSHQFQGWCRNTRICDNSGNCRVECLDEWLQWNSCTENSSYRPPNCSLYNAENCTQQVTATGVNVHGTRTFDLPVRCPVDVAGDGISDEGGCGDVQSFSPGTNFMSLYEMDPAGTDELVQTLYFPAAALGMTCGIWGCDPIASSWVAPEFYDSPSNPARVFAELSIIVSAASFVDTSRACGAVAPAPAIVSAASYGPDVASDSLATAFGAGLASGNAGTTIVLTDSTGVPHLITPYYTSPGQLNFHIPPSIPAGNASVRVMRTDSVMASTNLRLQAIAPALFSQDSTGQGLAAAIALRIEPDGRQTVLPAGEPIDLDRGPVYLSLYGTGIRNHGSVGDVGVNIGGEAVPVLYAGPQPQYAGLDQVNVPLPVSVRGRGEVPIALVIGGSGGIAANVVTVRVR